MDTNSLALDEIRRITSRWLTDLSAESSDAMRNIAAVFVGGPTSVVAQPQVNVGMNWELVEQTTSRLADSMDEASRETSMALREGLLERLEFAISEAVNKPGVWRESIIAGGFVASTTGVSLGKLNQRRDAWLAVAAVNALPELIERVRGAELGERAADNQVEKLQAEVARLRAESEEMRALALEGANTIIDIKTQETAAARDVLAERRRQVEGEGFTPARDDAYKSGQLAAAGAAYSIIAYRMAKSGEVVVPACWPWDICWLKPGTPRHNLVRAGALILAEIERLDRAEAKGSIISQGEMTIPGGSRAKCVIRSGSPAPTPEASSGLGTIECTMRASKPAELFSDAAEARIDVIGQNGNDGEHYEPPAATASWIEWKGGRVGPGQDQQLAWVKLRSGSIHSGPVSTWIWAHRGDEDDIVAYLLAGA